MISASLFEDQRFCSCVDLVGGPREESALGYVPSEDTTLATQAAGFGFMHTSRQAQTSGRAAGLATDAWFGDAGFSWSFPPPRPLQSAAFPGRPHRGFVAESLPPPPPPPPLPVLTGEIKSTQSQKPLPVVYRAPGSQPPPLPPKSRMVFSCGRASDLPCAVPKPRLVSMTAFAQAKAKKKSFTLADGVVGADKSAGTPKAFEARAYSVLYFVTCGLVA